MRVLLSLLVGIIVTAPSFAMALKEAELVAAFETVCLRSDLSLNDVGMRAKKGSFEEVDMTSLNSISGYVEKQWQKTPDTNRKHILLIYSTETREHRLMARCRMASIVSDAKKLANLVANIPKVNLNEIDGRTYVYSTKSYSDQRRYMFMSWEKTVEGAFVNIAVQELEN